MSQSSAKAAPEEKTELRETPNNEEPDGASALLRTDRAEPPSLAGYARIIRSGTNKDLKYPDNYVHTTHFTVLNFLPVSISNQFRNMANVYFFVIAVLCSIEAISPYSPVTAIVPLMFVVGVGVLREGIEDFYRWSSDKEQNSKVASVLSLDGGGGGAGGGEPRAGSPAFVDTPWRDIRVGDLVHVKDKQPIPADLMLLWSSAEDGVAYIDTVNLDGETNLKRRKAKDATAPLLAFGGGHLATAAAHAATCATLGCIAPDGDLYKFRGVLQFSSAFADEASGLEAATSVDASEDQLLLRGSNIRNTPVLSTGGTNGWVVGLVVYSGHDTKEMQNSKDASHKQTNFQRKLNRLIVFLFASVCVCCLFAGVLGGLWTAQNAKDAASYLDAAADAKQMGFIAFFSYAVLLNTFIPASLVVTVEFVKVVHALFINWDLKMFHGWELSAVTGKPKPLGAAAKSMTLQEELGQITHVFSDKTGTLTENRMEFRKCVCAGDPRPYGDADHEDLLVNPAAHAEGHEPLKTLAACALAEPGGVADWFLTALAVAHTVLLDVDLDTGEKSYNADSPDEVALVKGGVSMSYVFESRQGDSAIFISKGGKAMQFEVLESVEFTSARKRMSVIVREKVRGGSVVGSGLADDGSPHGADERRSSARGGGGGGAYYLLTKGADSVMLDPQPNGRAPRVRATDGVQSLRAQLDGYAVEGLRTLVFAYKPLDARWCDAGSSGSWLSRYRGARQLADPDVARATMEGLEAELEDGLELLGATAIEDKLQTGVPWTIRRLADANIALWVLTGDKKETAIEIAKSCALIVPGMDVHELVYSDETALDAALKRACGAAADSDNAQALVIDGATLTLIVSADADGGLVCQRTADHFVTLARLCQSVVLCRSSPLQKALVVMLVRRYDPAAITLAIGDGANDVSMIRAAHVGIGVAGQEGMQAVRSSDYSIQQFRDLQRLLLHHGRLSYMRLANMTMYFFYKNISFTFVLWIFGFYSGWSAQPCYIDMLVTGYNMVFTLLPPFVYAVMEQDVAEEKAELFPSTYGVSQRDLLFSWRAIANEAFIAFAHALVFFFVPLWALPALDAQDPAGLWTFGNASFAIVLVHVHVRLFVITRHWSVVTVALYGLSVLSVFLFTRLYDDWPSWLAHSTIVTWPYAQGAFARLYGNVTWWLLCLFCVGGLTGCQLAAKAAGEVFGLYGTPTPIDVVRLLSLAECQSRSKHHEAGSDTGGEGDACSRRRLSLEERSSMQIQYSQSGRTITGGGPVGNGAADGTAADESVMATVRC